MCIMTSLVILDICYIPEAIFNARTFKVDTNVVVSLTLDKSSRFCWINIYEFVIIPLHNGSFDFEWKGSSMNW